MTSYLVSGNPLDPQETDLIACTEYLPMGKEPIPDSVNYGWRILSGNHLFNLWGRLAYRYEIG